MTNNLPLFGIADEYFIREQGVPMTKRDVRVLSIANLQLYSGAIVYDIGAGSGSVAIECKRLVGSGKVFAIEKKAHAVELIMKNAEKFAVDIDVIADSAPNAMLDLPIADRIFIGGSGGNIIEIIDTADQKLASGGRIVLNFVTMMSSAKAWEVLQSKNYKLAATLVNLANITKLGQSDMWQAGNPVTIITAEKPIC